MYIYALYACTCIYIYILLYSVKTIVTVGYFFPSFYDGKIPHCCKTSESGGHGSSFYDFRPCRQHFRCEGDTPEFYSKHRSLSSGLKSNKNIFYPIPPPRRFYTFILCVCMCASYNNIL